MTGTELDRRTLLLGGVAAAALASSRWWAQPGSGRVPGVAPESATPARGLPEVVVAGYWPYWSGPPLREVDRGYNTLFLFHAEPVGGPPGATGAVRWRGPRDHRFAADLADWRAAGGRALLTVGGERAQLILDSRSKSEAFLDSIRRIHRDLGGFDGLDWNNYEDLDEPPTAEMIWTSLALKREYGPDFCITTPPAPQSETDMVHCRAMLDAGALDLVAPQFYGGPGLDQPRFIRDSVRAWAGNLRDASVLAIGLRVGAGAGHLGPDQAVSAWEQAVGAAPDLRGAFNWHVSADALAGWAFARVLGPRLARGTAPITPLGPELLPILGRPELTGVQGPDAQPGPDADRSGDHPTAAEGHPLQECPASGVLSD